MVEHSKNHLKQQIQDKLFQNPPCSSIIWSPPKNPNWAIQTQGACEMESSKESSKLRQQKRTNDQAMHFF